MPLPHTSTPNATISFVPTPQPTAGSRGALPSQFVHAAMPSFTAIQTLDAPALLRPMSFRDAQAYGIQGEGVDVSFEGRAGFWRLPVGEVLPDWVISGVHCTVSQDGQKLRAVYHTVAGRTDWGKSRGLGPDFVLQVMRQN